MRRRHTEEVQIREEAKEEFEEGTDSCVEQGRESRKAMDHGEANG